MAGNGQQGHVGGHDNMFNDNQGGFGGNPGGGGGGPYFGDGRGQTQGEQWGSFGHPLQQGFGGFNMSNGLYHPFGQGISDKFQGGYGHQGTPHHLPQGPQDFH
jgi:hypothetical protein